MELIADMVQVSPQRISWSAFGALLSLILLSLLAVPSLAAPVPFLQEEDETAAEPGEPAETADVESEEEPDAGEEGAEETAEKMTFKQYFTGWNWLKWLHDTTEGKSGVAARWFDGFFGNSQMEQQADISFGRLSTGIMYNTREDFDYEFRLRMKFLLPQTNNKLRLMVGRVNADDYISDSPTSFEALPEAFSLDDEDEWLMGFGYNPISGSRSRLHFSVGTKFSWPLEPYVKARYYYKFITGSRSQIRTQETVFWRSEEGFGSQTNVSFEYMPGHRHLIRWANGLEYTEVSRGLIWQSRVTLYQELSEKRAMAYQIGARGETDMPDPIEYYGFRVLYRQNALWDWFFWEARTGVMWPRNETLNMPALENKQPHEAVPFVYLGVEMFFGKGPRLSRGLD